MRTKLRMALIVALVLLLVLGGLLYFVPRSTPFDLTLNATKFDSDGNEIGTTQLSIRGKGLDYLLQKDRLEIEVDPFDEWSSFGQVKNSSSGKKGEIISITDKLMYITFHAVEGDEFASCILYFTIDFDHFVLYIDTDEGRNTYLASVGNDHSADKVIEHFKSFNFNPVPNHKHSTELTLNATKLDADRNMVNTMQITVHVITNYYNRDEIENIIVDPFDGWNLFEIPLDSGTGERFMILSISDKFREASLWTISSKGIDMGRFAFTDDFDYIVLRLYPEEGTNFYIASAGDHHSVEEVIAYFESIVHNFFE